MKFTIKFKGTNKGIGNRDKKFNFRKKIEAPDLDKAILSLYEQYEFIEIESINGHAFNYERFKVLKNMAQL